VSRPALPARGRNQRARGRKTRTYCDSERRVGANQDLAREEALAARQTDALRGPPALIGALFAPARGQGFSEAREPSCGGFGSRRLRGQTGRGVTTVLRCEECGRIADGELEGCRALLGVDLAASVPVTGRPGSC
jgi:hypothetical protein